MSEESDHIDLFDKYLSGELTSSERLTFEQRVEEEENFGQEFEQYKQALALIEANAFGAEVRSYLEGSRKQTSFFDRRWIGVAASIVLVVLFSVIYSNRQNDPADLMKEYYAPYPNLLNVRSDEDKWSVLKTYSAGQYEEAVELLLAVEPNDTSDFYLGLSYLSLGVPEKAAGVFGRIPDESIFIQQVNWYTALTALAQEETEKSIDLLRLIQQDEYKYQEAQELLDLLE